MYHEHYLKTAKVDILETKKDKLSYLFDSVHKCPPGVEKNDSGKMTVYEIIVDQMTIDKCLQTKCK